MKWLDGITDSMGMSLKDRQSGEMVKDGEAWRAAVHEVTNSWTRQQQQVLVPNVGLSTDWLYLLWAY